MESNGPAEHEAWRQALRRGDPFTAGGELTSADVAALRSRVLRGAQAEARPAPSWLRGHRLPAVATIVVVLAAGLWTVEWLWPSRPGERPVSHLGLKMPARPAVPALPAPPALPSLPLSAVAAPGGRAAPASGSPASVLERIERRQLQFTTPGGTRVIWVLDPNFTLRPSAPQQEDLRWSAEQ